MFWHIYRDMSDRYLGDIGSVAEDTVGSFAVLFLGARKIVEQAK